MNKHKNMEETALSIRKLTVGTCSVIGAFFLAHFNLFCTEVAGTEVVATATEMRQIMKLCKILRRNQGSGI